MKTLQKSKYRSLGTNSWFIYCNVPKDWLPSRPCSRAHEKSSLTWQRIHIKNGSRTKKNQRILISLFISRTFKTILSQSRWLRGRSTCSKIQPRQKSHSTSEWRIARPTSEPFLIFQCICFLVSICLFFLNITFCFLCLFWLRTTKSILINILL